MTEANSALNSHSQSNLQPSAQPASQPNSDESTVWTDPFTGLEEDELTDGDFSLTELFQNLADEAPDIPEDLPQPPEIIQVNALEHVQLEPVESLASANSLHVEPTAVETAYVEPTYVEPTCVEPTAVETAIAEVQTELEAAIVDLADSSHAVNRDLETRDLEPRHLETNVQQTLDVQPYLDVDNETDPPNLTDLISLIQELNQCNSVLLDRVSQLEEALEQSHNTSKSSEIPRYNPQVHGIPEGWSISQEQITTLTNQLEFAHQTNQRQQILNEALTGQLETSQERVAQLEREAAFLQQRYNEQTQALIQAETTNQELQSRLYRQQRYTLQFKAALEKCLEVPPPQYEPQYEGAYEGAIADATENLTDTTDHSLAAYGLAAPSAQIKPWSADKSAAIHLPGVKPNGLLDAGGSRISRVTAASAPVENLNLSDVELPEYLRAIARSASSANVTSATPESETPVWEETNPFDARFDAEFDAEMDLETDPETVQPSPAQSSSNSLLPKALDNAVQPLADLLAKAMLKHGFQSNGTEFVASDMPSDPAESASEPASHSEQFVSGVVQPTEDLSDTSQTYREADIPWDELAHLVDASNPDAVRASLSGDFSAFASINFDALDGSTDVPVVTSDSSTEIKQVVEPVEAPSIAPTIEPQRKRSLAMVDLPTFPRMTPSRPATT
jgi:hypothetical protein